MPRGIRCSPRRSTGRSARSTDRGRSRELLAPGREGIPRASAPISRLRSWPSDARGIVTRRSPPNTTTNLTGGATGARPGGCSCPRTREESRRAELPHVDRARGSAAFLRERGVTLVEGLGEDELRRVEERFGFEFGPDHRALLQLAVSGPRNCDERRARGDEQQQRGTCRVPLESLDAVFPGLQRWPRGNRRRPRPPSGSPGSVAGGGDASGASRLTGGQENAQAATSRPVT